MKLYNEIIKTVALLIGAVFVFFFMKFTNAYISTNKYTYFKNESPLRINNESGFVGNLEINNEKLTFKEIGADSLKIRQ